MLHEKIKTLRKANHMTQEELAEKIGVSRQAITKWETNLGTPDLMNLDALAKVFSTTIDDLLSENEINRENVSRTEFDIFEKSDFHLNVGIANSLDVTTTNAEKVIVEVRSDLDRDSYKLAKVKLTEGKHVDLVVVEYKTDKKFLDIKADRDLTKQDAKQHLFIRMILPEHLTSHIELEGNLENLYLHDFQEEKKLEFTGKANHIQIERLKGILELDTNSDAEISYDGSLHSLEINQIRAISTLVLKEDKNLKIESRGRNCKIVLDGTESDPESTDRIELNGFGSELTVRKG